MIIENEKIQYENPLLSVKVFQTSRDSGVLGKWHYHKEIEILTVHRGRLEVHVEEEVYMLSPGDSVLIGISQLHRDRNDSDEVGYTVLQLDIQHYFDEGTLPYLRMFTDSATPLSQLNYILAEDENARKTICECVSSIQREFHEKNKGYEIAITLLVKQIVLTLLRADSKKLLGAIKDPDFMRLKPALDYVEKHINDRIIVENVCRTVNMSYYYFVKYFKRTLGMSFTEYVNMKKIKRAEKILLTKKLNISSIGESIGMPNMAHFYKMFKKYNQCSPNEYRKKMLGWSD